MTHTYPIIHIEIPTASSKQSAEFYKNVFNWQIQVDEGMDYTMFAAEGGPGGGFTPVQDDNPVNNVMLYIDTPNMKESLEQIKANGGKVLMESMEIPTVGTMAIFSDPTGNHLALIQMLPRE